MTPLRPPSPGGPATTPRRYRWIVSAFLLLHLISGAVYLGPTSEGGIAALPDWLGQPILAVSLIATRLVSPVSDRYIRLFHLRQDWRLFAPGPTHWTSVLDVVAFYPRDPSDPLSRALWETASAGVDGADGLAPAWPDSAVVDPDRWAQDTVRIRSGPDDPFPHHTRQREYRLIYNMGIGRFFHSYGAIYARWQCKTLRDERGLPPDGIQIFVDWMEVPVPWIEPEPDYPVSFMGGFTCPSLLAVEVG